MILVVFNICSYFFSRHGSWKHVKNLLSEAVLASTDNLTKKQKYEKRIPLACKFHFYFIQVGCKV